MIMHKKIGFTGTQQGMTEFQKKSFAKFIKAVKPIEFHHGDCIGADEQAHNIVRAMVSDCKIVIHPPKENSKRAYCRADEILEVDEYLKRNHKIVDSSEHMIATPAEMEEQLRSGTWATIRYSRKKGKPLTIFWPFCQTT